MFTRRCCHPAATLLPPCCHPAATLLPPCCHPAVLHPCCAPARPGCVLAPSVLCPCVPLPGQPHAVRCSAEREPVFQFVPQQTGGAVRPQATDKSKTSNSHRRKKPQKGEEPPSTALHSTHHIMHTFNAHAHTKTLFFGRVTPAILHLTCGALPPSTRPQGSSNCAAFVGMPRPALGKKPVLSRIFPMRRHSHIADTYSHPWVEKWWKWVLCVVASPC